MPYRIGKQSAAGIELLVTYVEEPTKTRVIGYIRGYIDIHDLCLDANVGEQVQDIVTDTGAQDVHIEE